MEVSMSDVMPVLTKLPQVPAFSPVAGSVSLRLLVKVDGM
jgi:hypothetical protein